MAEESPETEHRENIEFVTNNNTSPFNIEQPHRRHLLSTSTENGTRFTARKRLVSPVLVRVGMLVAFLLVVIVVTIVMVVKFSQKPSFSDHDNSTKLRMQHHCLKIDSLTLPQDQALCSQSSLVSTNCEDGGWIKSQNGRTLISPSYTVSQQICGLEMSLKVEFTQETEVNILINNQHHTSSIKPHLIANTCNNFIIRENLLTFGDNFRVILRFPTDQTFQKVIHAHVSSYSCLPYTSIRDMSQDITFQPAFTTVQLDKPNVCSLELNEDRTTVHCDWWNLANGDNSNFKREQQATCVRSGVNLAGSELFFLHLTPKIKQETRAILVSPLIKRQTDAILFEMWYLMKCIGPNIKVYLIPQEKPLLKTADMGLHLVLNISLPAKHSSWKHEFVRLGLPERYLFYHLVIEATIPTNVSCLGHYCGGDVKPIPAREGLIALDDISIQMLHPTCNNTTGPSVVDCKFQTQNGTNKTTCGWKSSSFIDTTLYDYGDAFDDWRAVNSGDGDTHNHGATEQHLEGRGYIMTFDATGRADSQSSVKTPKLRSNSDCSCTMRFLYLLRGVFTPRMLVNIAYNDDGQKSSVDTQWSLFGHQSDSWEIANVVLNLHKSRTFEIEIRVMEVLDSKGDIHFDDVEFINCDFDLHTTT